MMHHRTKIIAGMSAIALVATTTIFIGSVFFVQKKEAQLQERVAVIAQIKANSQELSTLSQLVEDTKIEREKLLSSIVSENTVIDFLAELETLAGDQGIELKTVISEKKLDEQFDMLMLRLTARGQYDAMLHYIALIETLPYQSSVSSVLLTKDGETADASWEANIELMVPKLNQLP